MLRLAGFRHLCDLACVAKTKDTVCSPDWDGACELADFTTGSINMYSGVHVLGRRQRKVSSTRYQRGPGSVHTNHSAIHKAI